MGTKPIYVPINSKLHLYDEESEPMDRQAYKSLVKKLLYLIITKPDITFVMVKLSQFMSQSKKVHWDVTLMIFRYLRSSPGKGLLFIKGKDLDITTYSDVDYAGSIEDRKSTTGFCIFMGDNQLLEEARNKQLLDLLQNLNSGPWVISISSDCFIFPTIRPLSTISTFITVDHFK